MQKRIRLLLISIVVLAGLLRLPMLDKYPPSLYSDEISQGYNAYSVLLTGHDEYGKYIPVSFRSFGDWKPPVQTYVMIPTIWMFGLNAWGVRLPSAILGILTVLLTYAVTRHLLSLPLISSLLFRQKEKISLLASLFLAISPWHILQSRSAMLVAVALFFTLLGIWSFMKGLRSSRWWFVSALGFVVAIYSYYGMRVIIPLLGLMLLGFFHKQIWQKNITAGLAILFGIFLLMPLGVAFLNSPEVVTGRAKTVSVFYDQNVTLTVWDLIAQDGPMIPSKLAQFFHNKAHMYGIDIVRRFFQHFSGNFLYIVGDRTPPFQIPNMGLFYILDLSLLIIGLIYLIKSKQNFLLGFLCTLIIISVVPAALTYLTPASNRTLTMVIPILIITAIGLTVARELFLPRLVLAVVCIGYFFSVSYFLYQYFNVLPRQHADWWYYGHQQLIEYFKSEEPNHQNLVISGQVSVPYIFVLFYNKIDPRTIEEQIKRNYDPDNFGFEHVGKLGKYWFPRHFTWEGDGESLPNGTLLAVTGKEAVGSGAREVKKIIYPNGEVAIKIYEIRKD